MKAKVLRANEGHDVALSLISFHPKMFQYVSLKDKDSFLECFRGFASRV